MRKHNPELHDYQAIYMLITKIRQISKFLGNFGDTENLFKKTL